MERTAASFRWCVAPCIRLFGFATVVLGACPLWAGENPSITTNTQGIITFYVPAGQTVTYDWAISWPTVTGFEKTGAGRLVMTRAASSYDYKYAPQYIREGILEEQVYGAIGAYNNVYISSGAQLYLNFDRDSASYSPIPTYIKGIAGSGPDGTGAIRISDKVTKSWSSFVRNEFTLTGDTTIQCDAEQTIGFSTSSTLNLQGHKLTFNGKGNLWFGCNASGAGPVVKPGTGGGIVNNMTGWATYLYNAAKFEGDAMSVLEITASRYLVVDSLQNPFPWTLRNSKLALTYRLGGLAGPQYNVFTGPIEYIGENGFDGTSGLSITFKGRISYLGQQGVDPDCWRINNNGTQVYFESQATAPSQYKISMSGQADCYYLTDTSFPRWDAEDGFYYFSGPANYNTRTCELWLGSQGVTNYCTGLGVARAIESFSTWEGYTTSRQLRFRTFGDFTANEDVTVEKNQNLFEMAHTGFGTLTFAGAFPTTKPFHYRNIETNVTAFSGNHVRYAQTLFVDKGTVRVDGGTLRTAENVSIGGSNHAVNPTLVVGAGAVVRPAGASLELRSLETGSKPALLKVEAGGLMTNKFISTYASASEQAAGKVYKAAVNQYGDIVTWSGCFIANWCGLGFWGLGGGELNVSSDGTYLLGTKGTRGVFQQDGGTNSYCKTLYLCENGCNDYLMRGGRLTGKGTFYMAYNDVKPHAEGDRTVFTMTGDNPVVELAPGGSFSLNSRTNGYETIFNLNAGRFIPREIGCSHTSAIDATHVHQNLCYFNFNGGTLVWENGWREAIWKSAYTPTAITIYEKGGTIEVNKLKNEDVKTNAGAYIASDRVYLAGVGDGDYQLNAEANLTIRPPSGRGIKSIRIPDDMPRSGYVGIMPVRISDGGGHGATAALDFDMKAGTIAENLLVTCSGNDYASEPTVIAYGPDYVTEYVCTVELTEADRTAGPLVKTGPGTLTLKASVRNSFVGPYVVSNGTLFANHEAMIPAGMKLFLAGGTFNWDWRDITLGTLGGYGTIFANISVNSFQANLTDAFVADAADLNEGRFLKVRDEGDGYCLNHIVSFGADCTVRIEHPELLDPKQTYILYRQNKKIARKPKLDPSLSGTYRLALRNDGKDLCLAGRFGFNIIVR